MTNKCYKIEADMCSSFKSALWLDIVLKICYREKTEFSSHESGVFGADLQSDVQQRPEDVADLMFAVCVSHRLPSWYQADICQPRRREEGPDHLHSSEPAGPSALHLRPPREHR